jgi:hypothetical protein
MPLVAVKDAAAKGKGDEQGWCKGTSRMLPFAAARVIVRKLKLKGVKEWQAWRKSGKRPSNIPSRPDQVYRDDGWISYPDWLGKEGGRGAMLSFLHSRAIVRKLKLKSNKEWREWCTSGERPSNIPSNPEKTYRDDGWISLPDWLGYEGRVLAKSEGRLPFAAARAIVRKLKLKSNKGWQVWCKSGKRPSNIPAGPHNTYRDDGWISMPDWLGYEGVTQHKDMLPFTVARAIVRKLELKGDGEWVAWRKSGQRPSNIPSAPDQTYRDDGWISMHDWLGKEGGPMLSFLDSRAIAQKLKLKSEREWQAWSKSGKRPSNIPSHPDQTYRDDGWISWPDWLGYTGLTQLKDMLPFAAARVIAR